MAGKLKVESGIQLLARLNKKPGIENFYPILFESGPRNSETIELLHDGSTQTLLLDIISKALTPQKQGGPQSGVIFINTDGNFNFNMLYLFVQKKIKKLFQLENDSNEVDIADLAHSCMQKLQVLNVYDATQLYTTIHNIESILLDHSNTSLIVFDSLTAFYWSEQGLKITKMDLYLKSLLKVIHRVTKEFKVTILYTRPNYFTSNKNLEYIEPPVQVVGSDHQLFENIIYRIHLCVIPDGSYSVNVKTVDNFFCKTFIICDNEISWQ